MKTYRTYCQVIFNVPVHAIIAVIHLCSLSFTNHQIFWICDPKMICLDINMPLIEAINPPFCVVYFNKCNSYKNSDDKCKYQWLYNLNFVTYDYVWYIQELKCIYLWCISWCFYSYSSLTLNSPELYFNSFLTYMMNATSSFAMYDLLSFLYAMLWFEISLVPQMFTCWCLMTLTLWKMNASI